MGPAGHHKGWMTPVDLLGGTHGHMDPLFIIIRNNGELHKSCEFTMGKQSIYPSGQSEKWGDKMACDILAIWIETLGLVELTETSLDTSIPRISLNHGGRLE